MTTQTGMPGAASTRHEESRGGGLTAYASVLLPIPGFVNLFDGIAAIAKSNVFIAGARYVVGDLRDLGRGSPGYRHRRTGRGVGSVDRQPGGTLAWQRDDRAQCARPDGVHSFLAVLVAADHRGRCGGVVRTVRVTRCLARPGERRRSEAMSAAGQIS
jgi:hypothetical protein